MQKKKNSHFVRIDAAFLLDFKKNFKSRYSPWVYLYLKLKYNYFIQKVPNKSLNLNSEEISQFLRIDRATVHRCINELRNFGLIEKIQRDSYKINSETDRSNYRGNYIKVYLNLWIDIFKKGGSINETAVYYFMVQQNKHYNIERPYLECNVSQTRISKELRFDQRKTKAVLAKLFEIGLITRDRDKELYTKSPKSEIVKDEVNKKTGSSMNIDVDETFEQQLRRYKEKIESEDKKKEPHVYLWWKSKDGTTESPVIKLDTFGYTIDNTRARKSDGKPMSADEWEKQIQSYHALNRNSSL